MGTADDDAGTVRSTELEVLANVATVLQLCAAGRLRGSEKTSRPSAATVRVVADRVPVRCGKADRSRRAHQAASANRGDFEQPRPPGAHQPRWRR
ncbi:MAG: hypothetical protein ACRDRH_25180 [Pseudonocardia sp.]